jgi:tetratricopeptide (TPR) repeat protein
VRGEALLASKRVAEARRAFEAAAARAPSSPQVHEKLGLALVADNKPREALQAFARALAADPSNLRPLDLSARVLLSQKRGAEATALVEGHMKKVGESAAVRQLLGRVYAGQGNLDKARENLERAVTLAPEEVEPYLLLSGLHRGKDAAERALADLGRAVRQQPKSLQAWMLKGTLHEALGQVYEAEEAYRKALEIRPDFIPALNNLAYNLAEHGGNLDEAHKLAARARQLAPQVAGVGDTLGWVQVKKGEFSKALESLEEAARKLPDNPEVHYHLGKAYAGLGERDRAAAALRKALRLSAKFSGADDARKTLEEVKSGAKG